MEDDLGCHKALQARGQDAPPHGQALSRLSTVGGGDLRVLRWCCAVCYADFSAASTFDRFMEQSHYICSAFGLKIDWNTMAFDMYAGDLRLSINHSEEYILQSAYQEPEKYPELSKIWEEFYGGPVIDHDRSNRIVHELIALLATSDNRDPALSHSIQRFLPFFSMAYTRSLTIQCKSD
ncbi:MAG: hypothetical protein AAFQ79_17485 [Pseudomonadota bacterium]